MKKNLVLFASLALLILSSCKSVPKGEYSWIKNGLDAASYQLKLTAEEIADSAKLPRSIWVGYDLDFLCSQLGKDVNTFKDSLRLSPVNRLGER
ncbi:MAG: DUF4995 domain-containing protein, partial [Bacteroides sp.]